MLIPENLDNPLVNIDRYHLGSSTSSMFTFDIFAIYSKLQMLNSKYAKFALQKSSFFLHTTVFAVILPLSLDSRVKD